MLVLVFPGVTDFPDGAPCKEGMVLHFSTEDDADEVLVPRYLTHGADRSKIVAQGIEAETIINLADKTGKGIKLLEAVLEKYERQIRLVIFDPLTAYMPGIDINRENEVRSVFTPLKRLARKFNVAIVGIMHFAKNTETKAKYRSLGSVAFVNAARSVWAVGKHYEEDSRVHFIQTKRNYTGNVPGLCYTYQPPPENSVEPLALSGRKNQAIWTRATGHG